MARPVVIIDDDPADLTILKDALVDADPDIQCISFSHPEEAVRVITKELTIVPDLIFIDMNMPGKTGLDCLLEFRKTDALSHTVIVIHSSKIRSAVKEALIESGADYIFEKPATISQFRSVLRPILLLKR